jgi:hypothetical protein
MKFHRSYASELGKALGDRPELWRWRDVFIAFLTTMNPPGEKNKF